MNFDYLIVGAGSAGCVLANRLSVNPGNRVCLLEAGPTDRSPLVSTPLGIVFLMRSKKRNWRYWTVPQEHLNGRRLYIPRGKTLGGSSAVNAMIYTRGHRADYDRWAALGNAGWGFDEVLPIFRRSENNARGADAFHGEGGPLDVSDPSYCHPVAGAFLEAARQAGFPANDDFSGAAQEGVGRYQLTQVGGERASVARAYLHPVLARSNLTVRTGIRVMRVLMAGKRALGVQYAKAGSLRRIEAGTVIVCAGAINSPQLLLLSGIGPRERLEPHGIRQVHALPGVGRNLHDHPDALVVHRSRRRDTLSLGPGYLPQAAKWLWRYLRWRDGAFTTNVAEVGGFVKSQAGEAIPDLQLHLSAALLDNHGLDWRFGMGWGYSAHVSVLRPRARGGVTLRDANPARPAAIDPNLLADPDDARRLLRGVRILREILAQDALAPWRGRELLPGEGARSDAELRRFLRAKTEAIYHPVGTCKMGNDEMAVVDHRLKVHGLENLYVVDASVMPAVIGGNTNAPTVMIAEKAADALLGD